MSCAIVLTGIIAAATGAAAKSAPRGSPDRLVAVALLAVLLLDIAAIFNVVALYHPDYTKNPSLWYPLVAMPPLIELCIMSWPRLLPRVAMGSRYDAWVVEQDTAGGSDSEASSKTSVKAAASGELLGEEGV